MKLRTQSFLEHRWFYILNITFEAPFDCCEIIVQANFSKAFGGDGEMVQFDSIFIPCFSVDQLSCHNLGDLMELRYSKCILSTKTWGKNRSRTELENLFEKMGVYQI